MFDPGSVPMLATHESRDIALDPLEPVDLTHPPGASPMLYNNTLIWSIIKGIISQGLNVTWTTFQVSPQAPSFRHAELMILDREC